MKLYLNESRKTMVHTRSLGDIPLVELTEILRKRTDMKIDALEHEAGISSRAYFVMTKGKNDGLKTGLKILDALGYDVIIQKRK